MIEPKTLPGFMSLLPEDQIIFNRMKDIIRKNFEKYGFLPLDTPVLESSEILLAKSGGETEKQIYEFKRGDNDLCMRFDLTVPLAKYVAENLNNLNFPFARYEIAKAYRGERPQKGRFREFYQCDIDVIGRENLSLVYDAQMPSIMYHIFKELDIGEFTIYVSNRKILCGLLAELGLENISTEVLRIVDKLDKIGEENFVLTLEKDYQIEKSKIEKILDFVKISGSVDEQILALEKLDYQNEIYRQGVEELKVVANYMRTFGIPEKNFAINLSIVRGHDYYTGTVYETFLNENRNIGSICGGGRFDNLAEYYTKEKLPGVGMSIGLTRLFYQLKENEMLKKEESAVSKVIILPMSQETLEPSIQLSNKLRENDINTTIYLEDKKFKNKIQYASRSNIKYAIFVGEDEVAQNIYTIKNLFSTEQTQVDFENLIKILKEN